MDMKVNQEKNMKKLTSIVILTALILSVAGCGPDKNLTVAERRISVQEMAEDTLEQFCKEDSAIKRKIRKSAGYGVFSNANINLLIASAGGGYGLVKDKSTGKDTYMKMGMAGLGLGLGAKDYRILLIFTNKDTMNRFVDRGWQFGAHADAAAKAGDKGGELSGEGDIHQGMEVYSMTKAGLALQATVTGTKYWKDKSLN